MGNYVYLLGDGASGLCAVIDPGWHAEIILETAAEAGMAIDGIILTHGHFDHVNAADKLLGNRPVPVYMHKDDAYMLGGRIKTRPLKDGEKIRIGGIEIETMHTPGHTPGSCCLLSGKNIFTGDTLFIGGCGRVDLPGSDPEKMKESLLKLSRLPPDTTVYPGHAYSDKPYSTIESEIKHNPYMALKKRIF